MKAAYQKAPFLRSEAGVPAMMGDQVLALLLLLIIPTLYYGFRVLAMAAVTVAVCVVSEILCCLLEKKEIHFRVASPVVTGLLIVMLMPAGISFWAPAAAAAFSVFVAKAPFGFLGHTPFHPAAAGVVFATLCWPGKMFLYPDMGKGISLPLFEDCYQLPSVQGPAAALKDGVRPDMVPLEMLWGQYAGPIGATSILVAAACGLYLFVRRTADWRMTAGFLAAAALYAALFPRIIGSPLTSVKYEMMAGSLFFCAVFLVTDPATSPRSIPGKYVYGVLAGLMTMLFRYFGVYEQGACFALLLANAFAPVIDRAVCQWRIGREEKHETQD